MLPGHKFGFCVERKPTASSSAVKKLPLNKIDKDRTSEALLRNDAKKSTQEQPSRKRKADSELNNSTKKALLSNPTRDENNINFNTLDSENSKSTIFRNWTVYITVKGTLAIQGNVKCGIISRTHPIAKRFTNTKVQCIYKRIYILDGTLVDERGELPEYVRRKFHNGFPDDWENVCQLWNKYRNASNAGSKAPFKWPPITDSDDVTIPVPPPFTTKYYYDIGKDRTLVPLIRNDAKKSTQEQPSRKRKADSELNNSMKKALLSNPVRDENNINFNTLDSENSESTIFRNWTLYITVEGTLAIQGNVKCGIISRTYSIAKRFTNTKVQCKYKSIYILDGTLVDERGVLPEYVRRKFHNGFPDDWKNVYKLWNKYINASNAGLKAPFKWPRITDSDVTVAVPPPFTTKLNNKKLIKNSSKQLQDQQRESCSSLKETSLNISITCDEEDINFNKSDSTDIKGCKVFSRWRVLIDDEGQLIIRGTLECGRIARSKPIIKRFTHNKVLSTCKWIYILDGTLVSESNDVPDYVRWKFHKGFPVDWENVYQHWKNYLAKRPKFNGRRLN